jgi:hypothetical protein
MTPDLQASYLDNARTALGARNAFVTALAASARTIVQNVGTVLSMGGFANLSIVYSTTKSPFCGNLSWAGKTFLVRAEINLTASENLTVQTQAAGSLVTYVVRGKSVTNHNGLDLEEIFSIPFDTEGKLQGEAGTDAGILYVSKLAVAISERPWNIPLDVIVA